MTDEEGHEAREIADGMLTMSSAPAYDCDEEGMMRRSLGLVAVLVVGLAGTVLAGAMYQNNSGAVARAVRIEFSEPAEITSMYPSFPQRDPQGASSVIVLSGGEVPAGGWFSFSWRPADARVLSVAWLNGRIAWNAPHRTPELQTATWHIS